MGRLNRVALFTADVDRSIGFFERIFDARVTFDREDGHHRRALIDVKFARNLAAEIAEHLTALLVSDEVPGRKLEIQSGEMGE